MINQKTLSVMQPYIFPYVGYFCLLRASDVFVYYDDVNYIRQGWINRNRILVNNSPYTFTIPVTNAKKNDLICDVEVSGLIAFKKRFIKTLEQSYAKSPYFSVGMRYVETVFETDSKFISDLAIASIEEALKLIGDELVTYKSSEMFSDTKGLDRSDRLIEIARILDCSHYVNPVGGLHLYRKSYFREKGVILDFIQPKLLPYRQNSPEPVPGLSIIDLLMNLSTDEITAHIDSYDLF